MMTLHRALHVVYLVFRLVQIIPIAIPCLACRATGARKAVGAGKNANGIQQHANIACGIRGGGVGGNDRRSNSERGYSGQQQQATWIQSFCRTPGNEFFIEV